ncbi:MAG: FAD:protein FMN transferase [Chitinophagales bacterium]
MRIRILFLCLFLTLSGIGFSQNNPQAEEVFSRARKERKTILMIFSGSDWCLPCIRLEKTIFADSAFLEYAKPKLLVFRVDFPQRKKLSPGEIQANEKLADEFNPLGVFPLLLLVNPDRVVISTLKYERYTTKEFIDEINQDISGAMTKEYKAKARLMGSAFEFIVSAESERGGESLLHECMQEVSRIEDKLSEFKAASETSRINALAGKQPIPVSEETYQLLKRCLNISALTRGAFDISAGPLKKLYHFRNGGFELPSPEKIRDALNKTGFKKIHLGNNHEVFLELSEMHISFAAIGKGYAAEKVKALMIDKGVDSGMVNASGDLTVWGLRPGGRQWKAGIANPERPGEILWWLPLNGLSIATSGNYEQYFEYKGLRYSHNINPITGLPVTGIRSASVISPGAELSDALATAVTVMGIDEGIWLVDQLPQTHCIMVDDQNGSHHSKEIHVNLKNA